MAESCLHDRKTDGKNTECSFRLVFWLWKLTFGSDRFSTYTLIPLTTSKRTIMWSTIHREVETAVFCRKMVESRREDTLTSLNGKPSQRLRKRWMDWKPMHVSFVDIIRIVFRYQHTVMPVPREQNRFLQQDRMPRLHWKWEDGVLIQGGLWKSWHREGIWQFIYSLNICINNMKFWFRPKCRWIQSVNGMDH